MGQLLCYPSDSVYHLNHRKYICSRQLGEGAYSIVYLVQDHSKRKYALKVMICQTAEQIEIGTREINSILLFDHPNIIKMIDHSTIDSKRLENSKEILMLTPYYKEGTLQDLLDKQRIQNGKDYNIGIFTEIEALQFFRQICLAVQQLHQHKPHILSHRDIKPGNILISQQNTIPVLTDFGSCTVARFQITSRKEALQLQEDIDQNTTPFYRAPELFDIKSDQLVDERIDIWALGCLLYAIAYNKSPFEVSDEEKSGSVALTVLRGLNAQAPNNIYSQAFYQLIAKMLTMNPDQRPYINQVLDDIDSILNH
ncbi:putative protein serine/threonine kinase [Tieghemostelium lacteum]|uniref:non-specific serine/threonine protein kinase n=1 Tax=Tieghemostelium lacteum TaxID=361077 RepID=A0A151ZEJ4_TIELA|nr:putative protein serine/threonine kinase [Tieghemostelium lacteum]|eukprot:KYQ92330.1 putative protein serine/threonine kinase [Tieghemostelium lacteum]